MSSKEKWLRMALPIKCQRSLFLALSRSSTCRASKATINQLVFGLEWEILTTVRWLKQLKIVSVGRIKWSSLKKPVCTSIMVVQYQYAETYPPTSVWWHFKVTLSKALVVHLSTIPMADCSDWTLVTSATISTTMERSNTRTLKNHPLLMRT